MMFSVYKVDMIFDWLNIWPNGFVKLIFKNWNNKIFTIIGAHVDSALIEKVYYLENLIFFCWQEPKAGTFGHSKSLKTCSWSEMVRSC